MKYLVEESLRKMVDEENKDFRSHMYLARFLRDVNRLEEGKTEFTKALDLIEEDNSEDAVFWSKKLRWFLEEEGLSYKQRVSAGTKQYEIDVMVDLLREKNFVGGSDSNLLNVGIGNVSKTYVISEVFNIPKNKVKGVDINDFRIDYAHKFFETLKVDLESEKLPFDDKEFSLVVCNQVFEHLKNIDNPLEEINRVLESKGLFLIGTPNLSNFYDRFRVLIGIQPTVLKIGSAHVRAFAPAGLKGYLESNGFEIIGFRTNGVYPFPIKVGHFLTRVLPGYGLFMYFLCRKK